MNELDRRQRVYVAKSARALRVGAIDRRQFMRALGHAGFGIASATYLSGCSRPPVPERSAGSAAAVADSGKKTAQQQFLKEAAEPLLQALRAAASD